MLAGRVSAFALPIARGEEIWHVRMTVRSAMERIVELVAVPVIFALGNSMRIMRQVWLPVFAQFGAPAWMRISGVMLPPVGRIS